MKSFDVGDHFTFVEPNPGGLKLCAHRIGSAIRYRPSCFPHEFRPALVRNAPRATIILP
ncbi:hypothetical protein [Novosphingobium sp.]|uniref:hypothetical protein n=1 Tax=Novosphingobium sp. TaxID=1874826 RepID=UPI001EC46E5F|nr:hypothetical protein [Novosphingobium sp.]MBK6801019.1 hypothetical protein [Novosphingobium sp.]MBK9011577.1 hypothetical protein [Novosphingobium sp.]